MTEMKKLEKLEKLARDLRKGPPRGPRETLGGYVILGRCVDKCRAELVGVNGEYTYWPCTLCSFLEPFSGIDHEDLKTFIATGADDDEVGEWFNANSKVRNRIDVIRWNNRMREMTLSDLDDEHLEYMEDYIQENLPSGRAVYVYFDVFDIEEGRI
jgi:hypothetical protein